MSVGFSEIVLYLTLFSVTGWIFEVIYCSVPAGRFINRGFLKGPYCPIYGIGATIILMLTLRIAEYPVMVFAISLCSATLLEYFTGWLMEALFQVRWWDYSDKRFNFRGRVCLKNSLLFGVMGLGAVYLLYPLATVLVNLIPGDKQRVLASVIVAVFLIDLNYTLSALLKFTERLKTVQGYLADFDRLNKEYAWFDRADLQGSIARLKEICNDNNVDEKLLSVLDRLEYLTEKQRLPGFVKSFPNLKPKDLDTALGYLRGVWNQRIEVHKESWQNRAWKAAKLFGRKTASAAREVKGSFAGGNGFYKLFWVFVAGSVMGYVVETLFCLVTQGMIESRQGLLYGPFSQIYGLGAVLAVLLLTPLSKKNDRWLFLGSAVLGGTFEFLCSVIQENVFGSVSWEYSEHAFSIGGRTTLTYMFFWGILGLVFIKGIYPSLSKLIERIPNRQGMFFSWLLIILLSADIFLSCTAVYRWSQRVRSIPPHNNYEIFLDKQYTDERLQEIYPNMTMITEKK